ncbi:MAG: nicotinate (nicotinamide) nucleotide adenylyltransferase [Oscillospiraceae bacterium]|nr:nicotinate (nicotinamide) nucleotide adenylyltransferase [Oscillospiraceae bacterium]
MAKIGIYGGSFNPVHNGHVLAATEFVRLLELDELLLIPAAVPPHKELATGSPGPDARIEMLRLAASELPKVTIRDLELKREGKSYTIDTVLSLRAERQNDSFYLLMGTDMFLSFEEWRRFDELFGLVTICVMQRENQSENDRTAVQRAAERYRETYGAEIVLLDNRFIEMSSTTVRRMLTLGCAEAYLPQKVLTYICQNGLYGVGKNRKLLPLDLLTADALTLYDKKRVPHALGCRDCAAELAALYGADKELAARAGILHDITKALGAKEQLRLCEKYDIMTGEYSGTQTKLLHGKTAAAAAKAIYGECDAVCESISWHTTGKADMTALEKIIYIADYIEPNRDFEGVGTLRELAYKDLDAAVLLGMDITIRYLRETGRPLNRYTVEARDFLIQGRK